MATLDNRIHETCVHHLISNHVRDCPNKEAVASSKGETLSYSELDEAANRVAYQLRANGAGPDRFVLLCFEKSIWTGE
jgi:non-ribosomal peptide synthetase component F